MRTATNSIETYHLLRTAAAPKSYDYTVTLAEGQTISQDGESTLIIGGTSTAPTIMICATLAGDTAGTTIPVALTAGGSKVTRGPRPFGTEHRLPGAPKGCPVIDLRVS